MAKQPVINGKTVERAYDEYNVDSYVVNRRYQRKLVWSYDEKTDFIDSLINGFPIPLFLFSKSTFKEEPCYEIIDGMQRLNAIFSFIENEYPLKDGNYFDLSATALTKQLMDEGWLTQKTPLIPREAAVNISTYSLPYSIYEENSPEVIDEVFRRINANGQYLSNQEIRQAGATSEFAQLVRKIAIRIRGDASHDDVVLLSKMKELSLRQPPITVGIDIDKVFWVKEGILSKENLRQSVDEEIIADIVAGMIMPTMPPSDAGIIDEYYNFHAITARGTKIDEQVVKIGADLILEQFLYVFEDTKLILEAAGTNFPRLVIGEPRPRAPRYFQILFLSLYELLIRQEMKIVNYSGIASLLSGIGRGAMQIAKGGGNWPANRKSNLVNATVGVLRPALVQRSGSDPMYHSYTTELENILTSSYTEDAQYDFKQGLINIGTKALDNKIFDKIFKTLACMANTEKNATGYVLLGIADSKSDAEKIRAEYGTDYVQVGNHFITGTNGEVEKYFEGDYDAYFSLIINAIQESKLNEDYKRQVGTKIKAINYRDRSVIIFRITSDNGAVLYNGNYYTRCGASNNPTAVTMGEVAAFLKKFE